MTQLVDPSSSSPVRHRRRTSLRVRVMEQASQLVITIGGLGVIAAVMGILVFLFYSVAPLFQSGSVHLVKSGPVQLSDAPLVAIVDEYKGMGAVLTGDGQLTTIELQSGKVIEHKPVTHEGKHPTSVSFTRQVGSLAFGYDDGTVQLGKIGFDSELLGKEDRTLEMDALVLDATMPFKDGYVQRIGPDQFRAVHCEVDLRDPASVPEGSGGIARIDYAVGSSNEFLVTVRTDGTGVFNTVSIITPLGGGKSRTKLESTPFDLALPKGRAIPDRLFVTGEGTTILGVWNDGLIQRYAMVRSGDEDKPLYAETLQATEAGEQITSARFILGAKTLAVGTSKGRLLGLFTAQDEGGAIVDHQRLVVAHSFHPAESEVTSIGVSQRDRSLIVGDHNGTFHVRNMTSGKHIADASTSEGASAAVAASIICADITPKNDGLFLISGQGTQTTFSLFDMDPKHSEIGAASLFGKVWYEGDAGPSYTYQSTTDDTGDPKLSTVPLIWGTLKATVYAMLFAVPLAILAAIYTSEMLHPDVRNRVKPIVESMASLPSVVLGFIAAMLVAPFARDWLPSILIGFAVVPLAVLLAAYIWQMFPVRVTTRLSSAQHFGLVIAVFIVGLLASAGIGPLMERALFRPSTGDVLILAGSYEPVPKAEWPAWVGNRPTLSTNEGRRLREQNMYFRDGQVVRPVGSLSDPAIASIVAKTHVDQADIRRWLDGVIGGPFPGWLLLMLPPGFAIALLIKGRFIEPVLLASDALRFGTVAAVAELVKFLGVCVLAVGIAALLGLLLTAAGFDARDSIFGPFNQRNSLVVGIIMGFAVIPIIFTVSEDALSSVSASLRSASLGAGATRWQTAIRVILPVAASGIFSACMIGLGRAAGETMIVVMATGNTPKMDLSIFSGFRTMAANIAVELPEAPQGSTHYRVLFLCALILFVMTFILNTLAELVRQRFRKRTAAL